VVRNLWAFVTLCALRDARHLGDRSGQSPSWGLTAIGAIRLLAGADVSGSATAAELVSAAAVAAGTLCWHHAQNQVSSTMAFPQVHHLQGLWLLAAPQSWAFPTDSM